ncbi:hypothetical protein STRATTON_26 [Erwinia phage vB_EamM_Stratton]|uniref:Uncharacterized protein n=2 Tax=Erskinevirus EaH2 TaxID=2169883 RepID=A0A1B2IGQ6_9CAUD|nr:hypothetical protein G173_gp193 [Erwinia phage phiEaH2]AFQ96738.1 hypothetical protein [Erwinia phage phiEaH2]ANZ50451.1 hypothetical protein STRATTON_26 [Erwinia phage vB_EamM_Stratton]
MTLIDHIASKAYLRILNDDRLASRSGYDIQQIKHIILDLIEYFVGNVTEHGAWDSRVVTAIANCYRKSSAAEVTMFATQVRLAMSEEMGIPLKGWRYHYRIVGRFIRFIPRKITDVYDDYLP